VEILAKTDPLTGALNRRSLFEVAERQFQRAQRYATPFAVLMMDIDHFKQINDCYGHQVGDVALRTVVQIIQDDIRTLDTLGRYGGEEFAVILPELTLQQGIIAAERIRSIIADRPIPVRQDNLHLTMSLGVAAYYPEQTSIDQVFDEADKALYQAKTKGRNRVCHYRKTHFESPTGTS
jgi:diguanylate cyclase (GGDEF)-like protein